MKKMKFLYVVVIMGFLVTLGVADDKAHGFNPWPIEKLVGAKAPDFSLKDLSGKPVSLSSFKGKPVLLNFWATWCAYCRKERPELNKLHETYNQKDLVIISVAIDRSADTVKGFMKKKNAPFPILTDPTGEVAGPYEVMGLPTSFLIDREGVVRRKLVGFRSWTDESSERLINELIYK